MSNFTKDDVGQLFSVCYGSTFVKLTKPSASYSTPASVGGMEFVAPDSPLLYLGVFWVQISPHDPIQFHAFIFGEAYVGVPTHLYDKSSEPMFFVEFGKQPSAENCRYGENAPGQPIAISNQSLMAAIAKATPVPPQPVRAPSTFFGKLVDKALAWFLRS